MPDCPAHGMPDCPAHDFAHRCFWQRNLLRGRLVLQQQRVSDGMKYIADMSSVSNLNYKRRAFSSGCLAGLVSRHPASSEILDAHLPDAGRGERAFLEDNHSLSRTNFVREVQKEDWLRMSRRTVGTSRKLAVPEEEESHHLNFTHAPFGPRVAMGMALSVLVLAGVFHYNSPQGRVLLPALDPRLVKECKDVPTMTDFNLTRFNGEWHVVAWVPTAVMATAPRTDKCMSVRFDAENPKHAKVNFSYVVLPPKGVTSDGISSLKRASFHVGAAQPLDDGNPAKLQIDLSASPKLSLWVLDTDYSSYALLYMCSFKLGGMTSDQAILVMGRDQSMGPMDIGDRLNYLQQHGLPWKHVAVAPVPECRA